MILVYVAGPYRGNTPWDIECNIHNARTWGRRLVKAGVMPVIPHANTAHFDHQAPDSFFLEATMELMRRCDGVLVMPNSQYSTGTMAELTEATKLGIPVLLLKNEESWYDLGPDWINELKSELTPVNE